MSRDILIIGGSLVYGAEAARKDILIHNGIIEKIMNPCEEDCDAEIIDATGCILTQSFADLHVHFREPGNPEKETIATGSKAAAHGGYTLVCAMPNLSIVPDSLENIAVEQSIIDKDAVIEVLPYASITKGRKGEELVDMAALKHRCPAFSDDGSGVQSREMMFRAMQQASEQNCIIAAHCEDNSLIHGGYIHDGRYSAEHGHKGICSESEWGQIARDMELCEQTGCHYHVCHISTKESVDIIRKAKARGVNVTCETAPHYLLFCEDDLQEDGRYKMNPPLRSASDREALIEGLRDGTIDVIATDHAPHTAEQKSRGLEKSAMGVVGLEVCFPVLYTGLVRTGKISLERLLNAMNEAPRKIFGIGSPLEPGMPADLTIIDTREEFTIDSKTFFSKGKSTPFEGKRVRGRVMMTMLHGSVVWKF